MVQFKAIRWLVIGGVVLVAACESGTQDTGNSTYLTSLADVESPTPEPTLPPPPEEGGIWRGTDSEGHEFLLLAAPGAAGTRITDLTMGYAGGELEVGWGHDAENGLFGYSFWALPTLSDWERSDWDEFGWSLCILDAEWEPRGSITGILDCDQLPDGERTTDISLEFDELYDFGADQSRLAGNWTDAADPGVDVLNISQSGELTGQNGANGCAYLGQAAVIDSRFNIYAIDWTFGNCNGDEAALNENEFSGLAILDDTSTPVTLTIVATGWAKPSGYEGDHRRGVGLVVAYQKY